MWVRKRIDIDWRDLVAGMLYGLTPADRQAIEARLSDDWMSPEGSIACLSVRSGLDLLFQSLRLPRNSQVVMSCLTIPDMPKIIRKHHLVPVPVDLDMWRVAPKLEQLEAAITSDTQAILVAHLFGGRIDMDPIIDLARQHDLLVIEDCAQAFVGEGYRGDDRADVSMFSFGPIKTNTALGGAMLRVRNPRLLERIRNNHAKRPMQTRGAFVRRMFKYAFVKTLSTRFISSAVARSCRLLGTDHDGLATSLARGFAGPNFFKRIRKQPSTPLLQLMHRRLSGFDSHSIDRRAANGRWLSQRLGDDVIVLGEGSIQPSYWVFPILVDDPDRLVRQLWAAGFDATCTSSLSVVRSEEGGFNADHSEAQAVMDKTVFLPYSDKMPRSALDRMAAIVKDCRAKSPDNLIAGLQRPAAPVQFTSRSEDRVANEF